MPIPQVKPGEDENSYIARCHESLGDEFDTEQRNAICFRTWNEAGKQSEAASYAAQRFNADEFKKVENVPVFAEHSTKDREGNLVVYDKAALQAICQRCNERIEDTGDFAPITDGHTPDKAQLSAGARMPDVLGYAGPYRLGMIGRKNPRWAIFADEWHHRSDADRLKRLRRRSPEVWIEERMEDRFMDPIAALGAETPRLDMGMVRMHRMSDGRLIEKYSAAAPSSMTVFVPSEDVDKHSAVEPEENAMIGPEDVEQIINALMETEAMQWVQSQMNSGPEPMGPEAGMEGGMEPPMPEPAPMDEEAAEYASRYMSGECDEEEFQEYMAGRRANYMAEGSGGAGEGGPNPAEADVSDPELMKFGKGRRKAGSPSSIGFTRLTTQVRSLKHDYAKERNHRLQLEKRLANVEREKRYADRYAAIGQCVREGIDIELDVEFEKTKDWSEDRFQDHLVTMTEQYRRIPSADVVPRLYLDNEEPKSDRYAKRLAERAVDIATKQGVSYDEAKAIAEKELGAVAAS